MIFSSKDNTTVITQEKETIPELIQEINKDYKAYRNDNLIVDLVTLNKVGTSEILEFLEISNKHRKARHSFVIVSNAIDLDEIPDEIIVVPTLQEAFDIIEMEEIERDLGL
jgi:hypothetical protein